jgi:hypothetical protein
MLPQDIDAEVEKLKVRKIELTNRLNFVTDFEEKEEIEKEIESIQKQIDLLESLRTK